MELQVAQPPIYEHFDRNKRDYDDLTTLFAEMVDGSMRTPFEFTFADRELFARDGSPMGPEFAKGLEDAKRIAAVSPSLQFEVRRRHADQDEYTDMIAMAEGTLPNTMVVVRDFPAELLNATEDVGGYNITRKQAMLGVLAWDGQRMKMYSQSLDRSDRSALTAIYHSLGYDPAAGELLGQRMHMELDAAEQDFLVNKLMGVYDRKLQEQYGGAWHAGRQESSSLNTYDFVRAQHDIIQHAMIEKRSGSLNIYRIAALLDERYQANLRISPAAVIDQYASPFHSLDREMLEAAWRAQALGKIFSACGVSIESNEEMSLRDQLREAGYGNKTLADKFGSLDFECPKGHANTRPYGKLIEKCQHCGISVKC